MSIIDQSGCLQLVERGYWWNVCHVYMGKISKGRGTYNISCPPKSFSPVSTPALSIRELVLPLTNPRRFTSIELTGRDGLVLAGTTRSVRTGRRLLVRSRRGLLKMGLSAIVIEQVDHIRVLT